MLLEVLGESLFWAVLSLINLGASILIFYTIKLEQKHKLELEHELSTRPLHKSAISLPGSFTYLSVLTGLINTLGAVVRFQQIHFLEIPPIPWTALGFPDSKGDGELVRAELLVAMNDWSSLFMALTFLMAGIFNFATVRQLWMRERWARSVVLPAPVVRSRSMSSLNGYYAVALDGSEFEEDDKELDGEVPPSLPVLQARLEPGRMTMERVAEQCVVGER